jgi:DNA repair exonuclease SbcCD ATPase subunit
LVRYKNGSKLAGIIYIHRISDERFTGISGRNFKMFRQLCGDSTLKNVVLVTNMWGKVEQGVGEAREQELANVYFKPALDKNAQLARHHNTMQSSHDIIRRIMKNNPTPLRIQEELVDEGKDIKDTAAGEAVNEELNRLIKHHEAETKALREEMRQALKEKDEETRKELEEETRKIREQMNKMRKESEAMSSKYNEERKKMEETMKRMQEEARQERERAHAEHMKQINELKAELERNTGASAAEREAMLQRIHELECQWANRPQGGGGGGGCVVI